MVMFNSKHHLDRALMYRDWGRIGDNSESVDDRFDHAVDGILYDSKFLYGVRGYNFKSSEVNAAFGLVQLDRLDEFSRVRDANFCKYKEDLAGVDDILLPVSGVPGAQLRWLAIPLQIVAKGGNPRRLELLRFLEGKGVQTRVLFSGNITRHPAYRKYLQDFPNSDCIMRDGFLLGCHHGMTHEDVSRVCIAIKAFLTQQTR